MGTICRQTWSPHKGLASWDVAHGEIDFESLAQPGPSQPGGLMLPHCTQAPAVIRSKLARGEAAASVARQRAGERLTSELIRLGPTYVKV